jgi:uncharacterized membrane protein
MHIRTLFQATAMLSFCLYLILFPGSTITVALDAVPQWGVGMGASLLLLQGLAALGWLVGSYGRRGLLAGAGVFTLAWLVEHLGETTGLLFGRYSYTELLQPQIWGVVPVPITCAWLMVALGSWQLAQRVAPGRGQALAAATLVVLLDLQIETIATRVHPYWIWVDSGPYYGVPSVNFAMWWVVGLAMAFLMRALVPRRPAAHQQPRPRPLAQAFAHLPSLMYLLSSVMFTAVNLSRGYTLAGLIGVGVLALGLALLSRGDWQAFRAAGIASYQTSD